MRPKRKREVERIVKATNDLRRFKRNHWQVIPIWQTVKQFFARKEEG